MRRLTTHHYFLPALLLFLAPVMKQPTVVEGNVYWENTRKPVANVYLYITEGVEESMSDQNGYFQIRTWKKMPVEVVVKYMDQKAFRVAVKEGAGKQTIWIRKN